VHAAVAHGHVVGHQAGDLLDQVLLLHADHGGHAMAHRVHGVVALVAVDGPVTGERVELDRAHLPHADVGRHLRPACRLGDPAAVGAGHFEMRAVHVDGVVGH